MHSKPTLHRQHAVWFFVALTLLAAGLVYQATTMEVITRDGVVYVRMARAWSDDAAGVVKRYDYHVAYPALIAGVHQGMSVLGLADSPYSWDYAGQTVSILARLITMVGIWYWARMLTTPRAAVITMLLLGLGRKWMGVGSDVLSDSLSCALQVWALVLSLKLLRSLAEDKPQSVAWALLTGVMVGGAYLVRPEGLVLAVAAGVMILWVWLRRRPRWYLPIVSASVLAGTTILMAMPYMLAIGGISKKKTLSSLFSFLDSAGGGPMLAAAELTSTIFPLALTAQTIEALHPIPAGAVGLWIILFLAFRTKPYWRFSITDRLGVGLIAVLLVIMSLMLFGLTRSAGYLSHRHLLLVAMALSPLIGLGVEAGCDALRRFVAGRGGRTLSESTTVVLITLAMVVPMVIHTFSTPFHEGKGGYRIVAETLATEADAPDAQIILADETWLGHYLAPHRPKWTCVFNGNLGDLPANAVAASANAASADVVVLRRTTPTPRTPFKLKGFELRQQLPAEEDKVILVYHRSD